jgi:hypothetical protein
MARLFICRTPESSIYLVYKMATAIKGYGKYARAVGMDPSFSPMEKAVFGVICCSINTNLGYAWISVNEIASRVPCGTATVNRVLKKFETLKIIDRTGTHTSYGKTTRITRILV